LNLESIKLRVFYHARIDGKMNIWIKYMDYIKRNGLKNSTNQMLPGLVTSI